MGARCVGEGLCKTARHYFPHGVGTRGKVGKSVLTCFIYVGGQGVISASKLRGFTGIKYSVVVQIEIYVDTGQSRFLKARSAAAKAIKHSKQLIRAGENRGVGINFIQIREARASSYTKG